ncbi:MAG: hypothetical protein K8R86_02070 [Bacteroidales bacterium]|nr:hypothetical protein [Bacteroidales bacterium]
MKKVNLFYLLSAILFGAMLVFASCTKEGAPGTDGQDGADGEDGINGDDGTASCILCHDNTQVMFAKINQWESSIHATGGNFERNGTSCAPCHTSQGFLERMETGEQVTAASISNPNPINCYTCHWIHNEYTPADWAITYTDPVTLWHPAGKAEVDLGTGNLCANCHQSFIPNPFPVPGGDNVTIGSPYWGAHHGPVANVIAGAGGYEVDGSLAYTPASFHSTNVEKSCITCHLATAYGVQAGGHNMSMTYAYHGHDVVNSAGCIDCHTDPDALETKIEDTKTEIGALLDELFGLLTTQGVLDSTYHAIPQEMTVDQAGGVLNFNMVREDKSHGIHNYNYAKALLTNSIEALAE